MQARCEPAVTHIELFSQTGWLKFLGGSLHTINQLPSRLHILVQSKGEVYKVLYDYVEQKVTRYVLDTLREKKKKWSTKLNLFASPSRHCYYYQVQVFAL